MAASEHEDLAHAELARAVEHSFGLGLSPCHNPTMPSPRPAAFAKALALADIKPQCPSCGAPETIPLTVVVLHDGEELGRCAACGGWLDQTGRPVGDGEWLQVIRVTSEPALWQAHRRT